MDSVIVRKYSDAIFDIALEKNQLDTILAELRAFRDVIIKNSDFRIFFFNPTISKESKKELIKALPLQDDIIAFLILLIEHRRERFLLPIIKAFGQRVNKFENIEEGTLYIAYKKALTDELQARLKQRLKELTGAKDLKLDIVEQPELIAGMRIFLGDKEIDFSYKTHLLRLKQILKSI